LKWLESLPTSSLPYIEMGFDALNPSFINQLNTHRETVQNDYKSVNLKVKEVEGFKSHQVFVERFPYWCPPYNMFENEEYHKLPDMFRVGDRVMNLNSTERQYVPFGLRGTVIGYTNNKVLVMFDKQFIGGGNLYNQCEMYRGSILNPNHLLNLTKRFVQAINQNKDKHEQVIEMFTEQNPKGTNAAQDGFNKDYSQKRGAQQKPPKKEIAASEETKVQPQDQQPQYQRKDRGGQEKFKGQGTAIGGGQKPTKPDNQKQPKPEQKWVAKQPLGEQPKDGQPKTSYAPLFKPIPTTLSKDFMGLLSAFGVSEEEQVSNLNMNATPFTMPAAASTPAAEQSAETPEESKDQPQDEKKE
jgi:hypothetical protein